MDEGIELRVEALCWCGRPGSPNARVVGGEVVYEGEQVVVGDTDPEAEVRYELLCRRHWRSGTTAAHAEQEGFTRPS